MAIVVCEEHDTVAGFMKRPSLVAQIPDSHIGNENPDGVGLLPSQLDVLADVIEDELWDDSSTGQEVQWHVVVQHK